MLIIKDTHERYEVIEDHRGRLCFFLEDCTGNHSSTRCKVCLGYLVRYKRLLIHITRGSMNGARGWYIYVPQVVSEYRKE